VRFRIIETQDGLFYPQFSAFRPPFQFFGWKYFLKHAPAHDTVDLIFSPFAGKSDRARYSTLVDAEEFIERVLEQRRFLREKDVIVRIHPYTPRGT
jgi:hypothetical protein